ncbi:MAG: toll/interleukin-1 receptor domain-containing protein [Cyanobacteria bacterium P01_A01_bin.37]
MTIEPVTVFFSYSHEDEELRKNLEKHLKILMRNGVISGWHDRKILPGDEWDKAINKNLNTAQIILLLISADFLASDYCWDIEVNTAMQRHDTGNAITIPVILRSCNWRSAPFGKLQALPKNAKPVRDTRIWPTVDDAFTDIAQGIEKAANDIRQRLRESYQAQISQHKRDEYRQLVRDYLADRKLTPLEEFRLKQKREALGLSEPEAQAILKEEQAPLENARNTYRDFLLHLIEAGHYPFNDENLTELRQMNDELELPDSEV